MLLAKHIAETAVCFAKGTGYKKSGRDVEFMENNDHSIKDVIIEVWKGKKKTLIFVLCIMALISTILVSFVMQNNVKKQVIDTITVEPIDKRNIVLTGRIAYSDEKPFADGKVQLHSDVRETRTDKSGWFLFEKVTPEEHRLTAYDKSNKELASATVYLSQSDGKTNLSIKKNNDDSYQIILSADSRYLELSVELKEKQLIIQPTHTYAVNDDGKAYNSKGLLNVSDGHIILPSGTVITENNDIIRYPFVVKPDNTVVKVPDKGLSLDDKTKIDGDGTITLPDGTVVSKDGSITDNIGEDVPATDDAIHVTPDGDIETVKPSKPNNGSENTNPTTPSKPSDPENPAQPDDPAEPEDPIEPDKPVVPDEPVVPDKPIDPDDPDNEPDHDDTTFNVRGQIKNNIGSWTNPWRLNTKIDLFTNQSGGVSRYKDGKPVIQPGSSGYYIFQIENKREDALNVEIYIQEMTYHLPLRYRLAPVTYYDESLSDSVKWTESISMKKETVIRSGQIATGRTILYRLEWEWPFDSGHDDIDTEQGKKGEDYSVRIGIGIQ